MPGRKFKAIGFDIGGVILPSERQRLYSYCQAVFGAPVDEIESAINSHLNDLETGSINLDQFWKDVTKSLGVDYNAKVDRALWADHYIADTPVRTELLELSDRLRQRGYKTGLLSNTHAEHAILNRYRHIFNHFDAAVLSHEIHAVKPEPEAFLALCKALEVLPSDTIFIDDLATNVAGAERVGMVGLEYFGYQDLVQKLNQLGIEAN
ncbi:MAG TPA: HAD family phosphatase [Candidatus Saccharimonadales bacterium]|nr:HAD family phosphatase [Candidatus Saccharimonadales bacterium]